MRGSEIVEEKKLVFHVRGNPETTLLFTLDKMINAGWVGKDTGSLMAHIEELKAEGIPAPDSVPICFPILRDRVTQDGEIEVLDESDHSGEAEYVLLFHKGEVYVAAGCDHTDRKLEAAGVPKSKVFYPNVISRDAWRLGDVEGHWDDLVLRCWIRNPSGERVLYQEEKLSSIIHCRDLVSFVEKHLKAPEDKEGLCIFSGTVPARVKIQYSPLWEVELDDPVKGRSILFSYSCVSTGRWFQ